MIANIYKTDKRTSMFLFMLWMLFPIFALLPPIDWERFIKGAPIAFLMGILSYLFLRKLSYVALFSDNNVISSLIAIKKNTTVNDIFEVQRGKMYKGLSIFGHQAFVLYNKQDGSVGHFNMSENLYRKEVLLNFIKDITKINPNIKVDSYYQKMIEKVERKKK